MGGVLRSLRVILMRFTPRLNKPRLLKAKSDNDDDLINNDELTLFSSLPNDVVANILSKLDIVMLCQCVAVSSQLFFALLAQIQSLSTPLPSSLIIVDKHSWHARLAEYIYDKTTLPYHKLAQWLSETLINCSCPLAWWHLRRVRGRPFSRPGRLFFQKFTGLKSLEVEFPTPDYLHYPNSWSRLLDKYEIELGRDFFPAVNATIVDDKMITRQDWPAFRQRMHGMVDCFLFHTSAGCV